MFKSTKSILFGMLLVIFVSGCETANDTGGGDSNSTTTTVQTPLLNNSTITADENIVAGTVLGHVSVASAGSSQIESYTIDDTNNFEVLSDGTLKNKVSFDYETQQEYSLSVYATNAEGESNTAQIIVNINNLPEEVAVLNDTNITVDENIAIGSVLGHIDVNTTGDSQITSYTIDDTNNFEVLSDGTLKNKVSFDYETQKEYSLNVYATNAAGESNRAQIVVNINDIHEVVKKKIPTLVVVMNWNNYSENDPKIWSDKIFNNAANSVNRWYDENTLGEIEFTPVDETQGTVNDGIIMVSMGKNHPGGSDDYEFRDTEIKNAISNAAVVDNMDFAALDINNDGTLSAKELQIVFIVAGGEESYGDPTDHSIWAHAWSFASNSTLKVDGVYVMKYSSDEAASGGYARFGANHGTHKATIGVMCHELGHSAFHLGDYYDDGGGSGLGWYEIMSGGSWAYQPSDSYAGETPTQYTAFNKIDAALDVNLTELSGSGEFKIGCSGRDFIKLNTSKSNEFFLIECRDSAKRNSDISLSSMDNAFGDNKLFALMYHVDTDKDDNTEDGRQTSYNHYKVALMEKDTSTLMTDTQGIRADFADVYTAGDVIRDTELYGGSATGYVVEITNEDYNSREMTIKVTK